MLFFAQIYTLVSSSNSISLCNFSAFNDILHPQGTEKEKQYYMATGHVNRRKQFNNQPALLIFHGERKYFT